MTVEFELNGQKILALNGGPHFTFSPAVSLVYRCEGQEEVDRVWDLLLKDGGKPSQCGWLTDKYGFSWQIVPTDLLKYVTDPDREKASKAMAAMGTMSKIDIAVCQAAYDK